MRSREVKAGRWTDGTVRQDGLWAEFYWVLDGEVDDEPLMQKRAFSVELYGSMVPVIREDGDRIGWTSHGVWRGFH